MTHTDPDTVETAAPEDTAPAVWQPPAYADPDTFEEHEVTLDASPLPVGGTLSVPRGEGPHPGLVLLTGGGPFDRDEAAGPNRPLKDLAWGLASRGVAVLRFDKITFARPDLVAADPDFTVAAEYVPHTLAAIEVLRAHPAVESTRIHVGGHSMGGKVAPRVAQADPTLAGLVLLAADAEPMHHAITRVLRYMVSLDPDGEAAAMAEQFERQVTAVDDPGLSSETPSSELPFGMPGSYWLDMRDFDQVAAAAKLTLPILILQGGRDYQVTVDDDLARWKQGLAGRPATDFRIYEADNHQFIPGTGPSTPTDYERAGHVDQAVVEDIAAWIAAN
jgi:dienelactone hydrolase